MTRQGIIKNLNIIISAAPGGTATRIFTIRLNGANTTMSLTFTGSTSSMFDIVTNITFAKGDLLSISHVSTGIPSTAVAIVSFELFLN